MNPIESSKDTRIRRSARLSARRAKTASRVEPRAADRGTDTPRQLCAARQLVALRGSRMPRLVPAEPLAAALEATRRLDKLSASVQSLEHALAHPPAGHRAVSTPQWPLPPRSVESEEEQLVARLRRALEPDIKLYRQIDYTELDDRVGWIEDALRERMEAGAPSPVGAVFRSLMLILLVAAVAVAADVLKPPGAMGLDETQVYRMGSRLAQGLANWTTPWGA